MNADLEFLCPLPGRPSDVVQLAHGGGGTLSQRLLHEMVLPRFRNPALEAAHDGAILHHRGARLAFSTDSYVVRPLEFPGGDIGALAVHGTVNDLAMCGARARWLSAALILEEGFPLATLARILDSMRSAAGASGVEIVTGDTKVVDRGHGDGLFITSSGVGTVETDLRIEPAEVREGDAVLVSGDLGRHGTAILSVREGLQFETALVSDCAPLLEPVMALLDCGARVHCLRDLTRGGLAAALHEIAGRSGMTIEISERRIPVSEPVRAACELLGLDALYVANEGRFVAFVPPDDVDRALEVLRRSPVSEGAALIGRVSRRGTAPVIVESAIGAARILPLLSGEQLPRIC